MIRTIFTQFAPPKKKKETEPAKPTWPDVPLKFKLWRKPPVVPGTRVLPEIKIKK